MHKVRVRARSSLHAPYWTAPQIREHHTRLLSNHEAIYGLSHVIAWLEDGASIAAEYDADRSRGDGQLLAVANTTLAIVQRAGLSVIEAGITETVRSWGASALGGVALGLGATRQQRAEFQFWGSLAVGALAGIAGYFVGLEIPLYRLATDSQGCWVWAHVPAIQAVPTGMSLVRAPVQ